MSWISDAISKRTPEILKGVSELVSGIKDYAVPHAEILREAEVTLELLPAALEEDRDDLLVERWEAIGRNYCGRDFSITEIPNTPALLKRSTWKVLEKEVAGGGVPLTDLVDSMMQVESALEECWSAMVHSYLGSRDIEVAAGTARMETLYSLTEVLSTESDSYQMYRNIVDKVVDVTGLARCSLLLFDENGALQPVASNYVDSTERLRRSPEEERGALASLVSAGSPVVLKKGGSTLPEFERILEDYDSATVLLVPLRSGGKNLGLLLLDEGSSGEFSKVQIDLAVASANQAAIAVEKSGLVTEMETRLKHMAAIGIVARTLMSYLDPKEQLHGMLEMANALSRADRGFIMLPDRMMGHLKTTASVGPRAPGAGEKSTGRVADWVFAHGEVVVLRKGEDDSRFDGLEIEVEGSITAPLKVRDRVIGVIGVATTRQGERYTEDDVEMFRNFAAQAAISIENTQLYERLQETYMGTVASLAAAIEARDPYTVGHSARVTQYAVAIAEGMELPHDEIEEIRLASLLHDLGKIGVPDRILNKTTRLSEEEYTAVKMHPTLSMKIIEPLPHLGSIIPIIYHHHEHYNGGGYVEGVAGDKIPLGSRIIAVADAFEAMTSDRPYRAALTRRDAMDEIRRNAGTQFDPEVVRVFLELLEKSAPAA